MRILQFSETKLTLQYRPFCRLASSLLLGGVAIITLCNLEPNADYRFELLYGFMMLALSVSFLLFADWVTSTADLSSQTITIQRKSIVWRARPIRSSLSEVQSVEISTTPRGDYMLRLRLHSGKSVALISNPSRSEDNTREMAHKLGQFTDKPVSENASGIGYLKEQSREIDHNLRALFFFVPVGICGALAALLR